MLPTRKQNCSFSVAHSVPRGGKNQLPEIVFCAKGGTSARGRTHILSAQHAILGSFFVQKGEETQGGEPPSCLRGSLSWEVFSAKGGRGARRRGEKSFWQICGDF